MKWVLDIHRDGTSDILVTGKLTPEEIEAEKNVDGYLYTPGLCAFAVYLGRQNNRNYLRGGGVIVDIDRSYVGYISEVKRYGIVSIEKLQVASPTSRLGATVMQVYCYVVEKSHTKRINLTPQYGLDEPNALFKKYLSDVRRPKVQLQEVPPEGSR